MVLYPLLVGVISLAFAAGVFSQYRSRRRPHQLIWGVALLLSGGASFAYVVSLALGGNEFLFRLYYLFGAVLMAPYLGLGSIFLAMPGQTAYAFLWAVLLFSLLGAVLLFAAPLDPAALHALVGGPGTDVLRAGPLLIAVIALLNTFGAAAVIGVAVWSAWRMYRRSAPTAFVAGNALIAVGTLVNSAAGSMARLGSGSGFWLTMMVGWGVIYAGFLVMAAHSASRYRSARG